MTHATATKQVCPRFHRAVELIGRRWTGAVLYLLLESPSGFAQLRAGIPGVTDRMLCERLRELEAEEIVSRTPLDGAAVRVQYALTRKGRALADVMGSISKWGEAWITLPARRTGASARTRRRFRAAG